MEDEKAKAAPRTIVLDSTQVEELDPDGLELSVAISGSNFFIGQAAVEKAVEVADFSRRVKALGLPDLALAVVDVQVKTSSGIFSKSSAATYVVKLKTATLDRLPELLDVIFGAKNIRLLQLRWLYEKAWGKHDEWVALAIESCNRRARLIAEKLGAVLDGPVLYRESSLRKGATEDVDFGDVLAAGGFSRQRGGRLEAVSVADLGLSFSHKARFGVMVHVEYALKYGVA